MKSVWPITIFAALAIIIACTTDQPKKSDAGESDAGAAAVDAGAAPAASDAGVAAVEPVPIPVVSEQVDAGHMGDAKYLSKQGNVVDGHAPVGGEEPLKVKIFNRVLVKPTTKDTKAEELQAFVEEKTGAKLEKVRRTAGTFFLLQFAPTTPSRNKAAQDALMQKLKDTKAFSVVEPDQIMTLKTP
ncbi:MAG: hypothetical protein Q8O67_08455 [Deltaproteobacteria bacterium]|nr:hypothetical protein [Deltaproteobacteria bacterium]